MTTDASAAQTPDTSADTAAEKPVSLNDLAKGFESFAQNVSLLLGQINAAAAVISQAPQMLKETLEQGSQVTNSLLRFQQANAAEAVAVAKKQLELAEQAQGASQLAVSMQAIMDQIRQTAEIVNGLKGPTVVVQMPQSAVQTSAATPAPVANAVPAPAAPTPAPQRTEKDTVPQDPAKPVMADAATNTPPAQSQESSAAPATPQTQAEAIAPEVSQPQAPAVTTAATQALSPESSATPAAAPAALVVPYFQTVTAGGEPLNVGHYLNMAIQRGSGWLDKNMPLDSASKAFIRIKDEVIELNSGQLRALAGKLSELYPSKPRPLGFADAFRPKERELPCIDGSKEQGGAIANHAEALVAFMSSDSFKAISPLVATESPKKKGSKIKKILAAAIVAGAVIVGAKSCPESSSPDNKASPAATPAAKQPAAVSPAAATQPATPGSCMTPEQKNSLAVLLFGSSEKPFSLVVDQPADAGSKTLEQVAAEAQAKQRKPAAAAQPAPVATTQPAPAATQPATTAPATPVIDPNTSSSQKEVPVITIQVPGEMESSTDAAAAEGEVPTHNSLNADQPSDVPNFWERRGDEFDANGQAIVEGRPLEGILGGAWNILTFAPRGISNLLDTTGQGVVGDSQWDNNGHTGSLENILTTGSRSGSQTPVVDPAGYDHNTASGRIGAEMNRNYQQIKADQPVAGSVNYVTGVVGNVVALGVGVIDLPIQAITGQNASEAGPLEEGSRNLGEHLRAGNDVLDRQGNPITTEGPMEESRPANQASSSNLGNRSQIVLPRGMKVTGTTIDRNGNTVITVTQEAPLAPAH